MFASNREEKKRAEREGGFQMTRKGLIENILSSFTFEIRT